VSTAADTDGRFSGRTAWARNASTPLRDFLRTETGGASVLLAVVLAALVWVNVDSSSYDEVWETTLSIQLGDAGIELDLRHWVNRPAASSTWAN
jgi:Na+/H+ antiporter NhaA